jgi:tRNA threonylcarbamoyl adenosine modification protein YeaZ
MTNPLEANQYALALHTSTRELGLAISNFANSSRSQVWNLDRELSSLLHQYLAEFIQPQTWADLAFFAVAKGPGGFTGTRIGVVTARTLAQQLDVPVFTISSLAAVAWASVERGTEQGEEAEGQGVGSRGHRAGSREQGAGGTEQGAGNKGDNYPLPITHYPLPTIAVEMPAQRGQLFTAIYQVNPENSGLIALLPDTVQSPEAWQEMLLNFPTPYELVKAEGNLGATVTSVLQLAYLDWLSGKRPTWEEALPFYGQHPVEI